MTPVTTTVEDLRNDAERVQAMASDIAGVFLPPWQALCAAVEQVGRAWCGSRVPEVGNLYERRLQPLAEAMPSAAQPVIPLAISSAVPSALSSAKTQPQPRVPAALMASCRVWTPQEILQAVRSRAGDPDLATLRALSARAADVFVPTHASLQRRLRAWQAAHGRSADADRLLDALAQVADVALVDKHSLTEDWRERHVHRQQQQPLQPAHRAGLARPFDTVPAHIAIRAELQALHGPLDGLWRLAGLLADAARVLPPLAALSVASVEDAAAVAAGVRQRVPPAHLPAQGAHPGDAHGHARVHGPLRCHAVAQVHLAHAHAHAHVPGPGHAHAHASSHGHVH